MVNGDDDDDDDDGDGDCDDDGGSYFLCRHLTVSLEKHGCNGRE